MRVFSSTLYGILVSWLFVSSFCLEDEGKLEVHGTGECVDCKDYNFELSKAFTGLYVTIDCKLKGGEFKTRGSSQLDAQGKFKASISKEVLLNGKLNEECYARLHSASATPCPILEDLEASSYKLVIFGYGTDGKPTFSPAKNIKFSSALCTSAFLWPYFKHPPYYSFPKYKHYLPPYIPIYKKPLPPYVPIYEPPVYTKPLPPSGHVYNPPVYHKPLPPPVPSYTPPVYTKPLPPPVPVYNPPVYHKPLPPPVPSYTPPVYTKPLPPPVPTYTPPPVYEKPLPPPPYSPVYEPPVYTKPPCPPFPPLYKFPTIPNLPPKDYYFHKGGIFPPIPPFGIPKP